MYKEFANKEKRLEKSIAETGMQISLTGKEKIMLMELVTLGEWFVNATKIGKDRIEKYYRFHSKIVKAFLATLNKEDEKEIKDDPKDYFASGVQDIIKSYENDIFIGQLSEKLADHFYPELELGAKDAFISHIRNHSARDNYERDFKKKGLGIIRVDIPDLDERVAVSEQVARLCFDSEGTAEDKEERHAKAEEIAKAANKKYYSDTEDATSNEQKK